MADKAHASRNSRQRRISFVLNGRFHVGWARIWRIIDICRYQRLAQE